MSRVYRSYTLQFKSAVLERVAAGESISALSAELGVHRRQIYKWRDKAELPHRRRGRPTKAEMIAREAALVEGDELAAALRRVSELERKVGQQAIELDFFQGALRRIKASQPASEGPGVTGSSPRSKR
jgi:transposase